MAEIFEKPPEVGGHYEMLGKAELVDHDDFSIRLRAGSATVEVTALAPDLFWVGMFPNGRAPDYSSEAIAKEYWEPLVADTRDENGTLTLSSHRSHILAGRTVHRGQAAAQRIAVTKGTPPRPGSRCKRRARRGPLFHSPCRPRRSEATMVQVDSDDTGNIGPAFLTAHEAKQAGEQRHLLAVGRTRVPFRSVPLQSSRRGPPPAAPGSSHRPPRSPSRLPHRSPVRSPGGCLPL